MIKMDAFLEAFTNEAPKKLVQFATVDSGYTTGRPWLVFDGESVATVKVYPHLSTYTPVAGDRVMVIHGVIMGAIV